MKASQLSEQQKEKIIIGIVIFLSLAVLLGQILETRTNFLFEYLSFLRELVDPLQYMIAMMMINFILVVTIIRKYRQYPNPLLNYLKWYFTILYLNDFIILVLRVIQKSNFMAYRSTLYYGVGKTYLILASVRATVDLTMTSAALLVIVYGFTMYAPAGKTPTVSANLRRTMLALVGIQWLTSIPVNFGTLISSRTLYQWSLGLGQGGLVAVTALLYWVVKEFHRQYHTRFFNYMTHYYGLSLLAAGLVFTYSMGSLGLMQRFPAGEQTVFGGFGQLVFYFSRTTYLFLNYFMFRGIAEYAERHHLDTGAATVSVPGVKAGD